MNNNIFALILFVAPFIFQSCAPSSKVVLLVDEKEIDASGGVLGVNLGKYDVNLSAQRQLKTIFGENLNENFVKYFRQSFPPTVKLFTTFSKAVATDIQIGSTWDNIFKFSPRPISNGGIAQLREPQPGTIVTTGTDTLPYLLFIDQFRIEEEQSGGMNMIPTGTGFTPVAGGIVVKAFVKFQFYLWDNKVGRTLFYGKAINEINNGFMFRDVDLYAAIDKCVKDMFRDTPFKNFTDK